MPFYNPPPSLVRGSSPDYDNDELSGHTPCLSLNKLEPDSMTCSGHDSQIEFTERTSSPSFSDISDDSSDDTLDPITPPPNIDSLRLHVKRGKVCPKPYKRDGLSISERRFVDNQLLQHGSINQVDIQKGKQILGRRLRGMSSKAVLQAVAAKDADVECRRICAIATAWEVYAREEHLKFLNIILEEQCETYANAASEPMDVTIRELLGFSSEELKDIISCDATTYRHDVTAFAVGDEQFGHLQSAAIQVIGLDNSDVTVCRTSGNHDS